MLDTSLAIVSTVRPAQERAVAAELIGGVRDRVAILGDDMIVTGGTLIAATNALLQEGVREVHVFATHALFTPEALEALERSAIMTIAVADTVALGPASLPEKLVVLSAADLLADTIRNVFDNRSVSALFAGENELF